MNWSARNYILESLVAGESVWNRATHDFRVGEESQLAESYAYFDTFDWRLWRRGETLTSRAVGARCRLDRRKIDGTPLGGAVADGAPAFPAELPPGPLSSELAKICGLRRLLPVVRFRYRGKSLPLLDDDGKTVVKVELLERSVEEGAGRGGRALAPVLRLQPIKGYRSAFERAEHLLAESAELNCEREHELAVALAALGREPGDYSSKLRLALNSGWTAARGVQEIYGRLFANMVANEKGTLEELDTEFLHDFRVAIRRTRSGLTQVRDVLPEQATERFRSEFSWIGRLTGPKRDLDVYLLHLPELRRQLPGVSGDEFEQLEQYLRQRARQEQGRLSEAIRSRRYADLKAAWSSLLEDLPTAKGVGAAAGQPVRQVAAREIGRVWRRVVKKGRGIGTAPEARVHEVRIDCKKLRYLLEFFRSLFGDELDAPIEGLKRLQDVLGEFNDYAAQREMLTRFAMQVAGAESGHGRMLLTLGRVVAQMEDRQLEMRPQIGKRFKKFVGKKNRRLLEETLSRYGGAA